MAQIQAFIWDEGEDLSVQLIYREGATAETATVVDLSSNYAIRMDIVVPGTKERVYTFNSASISDVDSITIGAQPDSILEGVLTSGAGGTPNINITVPRSLTLPGGAIYTKYTGAPPVSTFNYDIFLRNTSVDKQAKILEGTVTVRDSSTLWL